MSLLTDIQQAAVSSDTSIADLLRRCRVLATRLANGEMAGWVDRELNGYPDRALLPGYRVHDAIAYGSFSGPFGSSMNNVPIPAAVLPEQQRDWATKAYLMEPIRSYEDLLKSSQGGSFQSPWPGDLILSVQQKVHKGMSLIAARTEISRGSIVQVIEAVRNRVLAFTLDLEKISASVGESESVSDTVKEKAGQAFHTHIYGNVANLAVASTGFSQVSHHAVVQDDLDSLASALLGLQVPHDDVAALKEAIAADGPSKEHRLGSRVAGWLGSMVSKAASGAWTVGLSTAGQVLPKLLAKYYGLPD